MYVIQYSVSKMCFDQLPNHCVENIGSNHIMSRIYWHSGLSYAKLWKLVFVCTYIDVYYES